MVAAYRFCEVPATTKCCYPSSIALSCGLGLAVWILWHYGMWQHSVYVGPTALNFRVFAAIVGDLTA